MVEEYAECINERLHTAFHTIFDGRNEEGEIYDFGEGSCTAERRCFGFTECVSGWRICGAFASANYSVLMACRGSNLEVNGDLCISNSGNL